jgi:hypothetical protein
MNRGLQGRNRKPGMANRDLRHATGSRWLHLTSTLSNLHSVGQVLCLASKVGIHRYPSNAARSRPSRTQRRRCESEFGLKRVDIQVPRW